MTPHPARLSITAQAPSRPWGILAVSVLTADQIREAAATLHLENPDTVLTPARVFRHLGTRPDCGGCLPLFLRVMRGVGADVAPDGTVPLIGCATLRDIGALCPRTHQPCGDGDP